MARSGRRTQSLVRTRGEKLQDSEVNTNPACDAVPGPSLARCFVCVGCGASSKGLA